MKALIVVDVQKDFMDGGNGSLPVSGAYDIITPINDLMDDFRKNGDIIVGTQDWHNADNITDYARYTVVPRQGYPLIDPPEELGEFQYLNMGV